MKKSTKELVKQFLLLIMYFGFIFVAFGKKILFGYMGFVFGALGAILIFAVAFLRSKHLLQELYPIQETDPGEMYALDIGSFQTYSLIFEILITVGWPISGVFAYKIMVWLSKLRAQLLAGVFVIPIPEYYWMIPAFIIGILLGLLIALIGMKIILRNRYKSFIKYLEILNLKMDSTKLLLLFMISVFFISSILICMNLASYTRFTQEGIYIRQANQLSEEFHPYTQVAKIEEKIRKQKTSTDHLFLIQFTDGRELEPFSAVEGNTIPESYSLIMEFVSQKSGQPISQVETKK